MSAPLSNRQKAILAQLANRAFKKRQAESNCQSAIGNSAEAAAEFRHAEVVKACGKAGLRCCDQGDYKLVESHFRELLGQFAPAFESAVRSATENRRVAEYKLVEACKEFGYRLTYAAAIAQRQWGKDLDDCSEKQIWNLVFTVRNRGNKKRKNSQSPIVNSQQGTMEVAA